MKLSIILSAILLTLGWITTSEAQLIEAQDFSPNGTVTFTITLTTDGPVNVIADSTGGISLAIDGTKVAQGQNYNGSISSLNYVTPGNLTAGSHTVSLTGGGGSIPSVNLNGAATLIAANEPSSGASSAISTI